MPDVWPFTVICHEPVDGNDAVTVTVPSAAAAAEPTCVIWPFGAVIEAATLSPGVKPLTVTETD